MPSHDQRAFLLILLIAILAPILVDLIPRVRVPSVVLEIALGILVGRYVLGWVDVPGPTLEALSRFGMHFLFFLAGMEIDFGAIRGRPLNLAIGGWLLSLVIALALGTALQASGLVLSSMVLCVALTTTALGTLIPILSDAGLMKTSFGRHATSIGAMGEFGPIVLISALLTADSHAEESGAPSSHLAALGLLGMFTLLTVVAAWVAATVRPGYVVALLQRKLNTSAQLPVRVAVLLLVALVVLTRRWGLDSVLGAIAAGLVVNLTCNGENGKHIRHKLEGIGFGLFVPLFFIVSGIKFDLGALTESPSVLLRVPLFMLLFFAARGLPVLLLYRGDLPRGDLLPLALFSSTALPLVVAVTELAVEAERMTKQNAAALVGAGMASVLLFPLAALALRKPSDDAPPASQEDA